ncbi:MAG: DUF6089 family protein [Flavobacteriales bacterium]
MKTYLTSFFLFLILMFQADKSLAQTHELGVTAGGMGFVGDVGATKGFQSIQNWKPTYGLFYRYNVDHFIAFRGGFNLGKILADDANSSDSYKELRELHVMSDIWEASALAEYNFYIPARRKEVGFHTPYLFAGLSVFGFNPQAKYLDKLYDLQELGTEGQTLNGGEKYNLTQLAIPFGIGYKLNLQNNFRFSVELNMRKTFTDYLDDVSGTYVDKFQLQQASGPEAVYFSDPNNQGELGKNRGNANNTDWFYSLGFSLSYVIKTKALKCPNPSLE